MRREKGGRGVGWKGIERARGKGRERERERERETERGSARERIKVEREGTTVEGERGRASVSNNAALSEWLILLRLRSSALVCPLSVSCVLRSILSICASSSPRQSTPAGEHF
jgi:hypothetical protein